MKLYEIMNLHAAIASIVRQPLPALLGFKIALNAKKIEPIVIAHQISVREILDRFAEKDETGAPRFTAGGLPIWANAEGESQLIMLNETEENLELSKVSIRTFEAESFPWTIMAALSSMIIEE